MYKALSPYAIGVNPPDLQAAINDAKIGGFQGLEFWGPGVADLIDGIGAEAVKKMFTDAKIIPAAWGLPVEWRQTEEKYQSDLKNLARCAKAAQALGTDRCFTWVMPCSNERELQDNWKFHVQRFKPIAETLAQYHQRLGLEFIGPKTLRDSQKYPFIYRMEDMQRLGREIGSNVSLLVDCWHWYTSGGTIEDLKKLTAKDVVYVHVNDAPKGVPVDQQIDNVRDLPGATGVIDIAGFLKTLKGMGYDGPVTPEPFKEELKTLANDEARLKTVGESMNRIWTLAGL
ncbi:MAG TPA: sugar phosphate isomerase/epimerase family protein [Tepidisphaeraceae bacterium]|jgi:sugar phosphate isomerase/epimerase